MWYSANKIYNKLLSQKIKQAKGDITFSFLNVTTKINEKSAIGDLFQEWLSVWFQKNNIDYRRKSNTQEFPDFYLDQKSDSVNLLEIKTFDSNRSANFDIANFQAYCDSLKTSAYRLDADYLIFAYDLSNSQFTIKNIWLKKVWEIAGKSNKYPVKVQEKRNEIVNIRPISWYSSKAKYVPFQSRRDFVDALHQTLMVYSNTKNNSSNWLKEVETNYHFYTNNHL
jgi:type II restriction enzyme